MRKTELKDAQAALTYLSDTSLYNSADVASFTVTARLAGSRRPATLVLTPGDAGFSTLLTGFSNKIAAKRAQAQALLTSLEVTD